MRAVFCFILIAATLTTVGCVRRTVTITSEPDGALVWVNDREIGRTPVQFDFLFYGDYDVRLQRDGYEPQLTVGEAKPPLWDNIPLDLVAELIPADLHSDIHWHYELTPAENDPEALLDRATQLRSEANQPDS